jgi:hypothetical protein
MAIEGPDSSFLLREAEKCGIRHKLLISSRRGRATRRPSIGAGHRQPARAAACLPSRHAWLITPALRCRQANSVTGPPHPPFTAQEEEKAPRGSGRKDWRASWLGRRARRLHPLRRGKVPVMSSSSVALRRASAAVALSEGGVGSERREGPGTGSASDDMHDETTWCDGPTLRSTSRSLRLLGRRICFNRWMSAFRRQH